MNTIDEIALRVAEKLEPRGRTYSPDHYVDVVKLVLEELSEESEPKAYWHETETGLSCVNTMPPSGQIGWKTTPLFVHPANTEQIERQVAEDISTYIHVKVGVLSDVDVAVADLRSGKWREYL